MVLETLGINYENTRKIEITETIHPITAGKTTLSDITNTEMITLSDDLIEIETEDRKQMSENRKPLIAYETYTHNTFEEPT